MDLLSFLLTFIGIPYGYGQDSMYAMDCSGLGTKVLRAYGLYSGPKLNAQQIFDMLSKNGKWNDQRIGSFIFFGKDSVHIDHMGVLVGSDMMIEARGGDETVTSREIAIEKNAVVEITNIKHRKDMISVIRPRYFFEL